MEQFNIPVQLRWADLDANIHIRHSVYYDWGALSRITFFFQHGLTTGLMQQLQIGPIIFREECVFKKEIRIEDQLSINLELFKSKKDYSRWSIRHTIFKNGETVAAIISLDGAWIDVAKRKLAIPPQQVIDAFTKMPKSADFQWTE